MSRRARARTRGITGVSHIKRNATTKTTTTTKLSPTSKIAKQMVSLGILGRMSVLPTTPRTTELNNTLGISIVATRSSTVLFTKWQGQISPTDSSKLSNIHVGLNEFLQKRLKNIQNEAMATSGSQLHHSAISISIVSSTPSYTSRHGPLRPPAPLQRRTPRTTSGTTSVTTSVGSTDSMQSTLSCGVVTPSMSSRSSRSFNKAKTTTSGTLNKNSKLSTADAIKQMSSITFHPDPVKLNRERLDYLLEQKGNVETLHASITKYNGPLHRDKKQDWTKFGAFNHQSPVRGRRSSKGLMINSNVHQQHKKNYMPFYSVSKAHGSNMTNILGSNFGSMSTSKRKKKRKKNVLINVLPENMTMRNYHSRDAAATKDITDGTRTEGSTNASDTFFILDNIHYNPNMAEISEEERRDKANEITKMLSDDLMDPFDIIQRNRVLLLKK